VLDKKLARIRELLDIKEKTDAELAQLVGDADKPKRGRPGKKADPEKSESESQEVA
jgi:hypothetical protein